MKGIVYVYKISCLWCTISYMKGIVYVYEISSLWCTISYRKGIVYGALYHI